MIVVLTGSQRMPFNRLIEQVIEGYEKKNIKIPLIIQGGSTKLSFNSDDIKFFDFCSPGKLQKYLESATFVFTHGGTSSIISALEANCKIAVLPRLSKYNEHNDDHQIEIAVNFAKANHVLFWHENESFLEIFDKLKTFNPAPYISNPSKLISSIKSDIVRFKT